MTLPTSWATVCSAKAVVMGLTRYAFRREYTEAKLAAVGFTNIEVVEAFDGFHGDTDSALDSLGFKFREGLRPGHKGCIYTMMREWKRFLDSGDEYRLFFEDDSLPHLDLGKGLGQKFWDATPKDFDILYMGNMMGNHPDLNESNLVVKIPTYCLHAYMLSKKGARRIFDLSKNTPLNVIDMQLIQWQISGELNWQCWNGTCISRSYPTFDSGLPWQHFQDIITPEKDTGLFWQNMRVGTTLGHPTLQLTMPQYSI